MKLYSALGTCGTAMQIVLEWIGKPYDIEHLDFAGMKSPEYMALNPAGVVPTLVDEDVPLSEGLAILLHLVDQNPDANIGPIAGEKGRDDLYRWLAFISATLHPFFWPYFMPMRYIEDEAQFPAIRKAAQARVDYALTIIDEHLEGREWILGDTKSVADAFLYPMASWAYGFEKSTAEYPNIHRVIRKLVADPAVQASQGTSPKVDLAA